MVGEVLCDVLILFVVYVVVEVDVYLFVDKVVVVDLWWVDFELLGGGKDGVGDV